MNIVVVVVVIDYLNEDIKNIHILTEIIFYKFYTLSYQIQVILYIYIYTLSERLDVKSLEKQKKKKVYIYTHIYASDRCLCINQVNHHYSLNG